MDLRPFSEIRNGHYYRLWVQQVRDNYATGHGFPPSSGEKYWEVSIDRDEHVIQAVFNFPDEPYPALSDREGAIRRVRAYIDRLPPGDY